MFQKVRELCRTHSVQFPSKTDFMAPGYDEKTVFAQVQTPNFGQRYVWATERRPVRGVIGVGKDVYRFVNPIFRRQIKGFSNFCLQLRILHTNCLLQPARSGGQEPGENTHFRLLFRQNNGL